MKAIKQFPVITPREIGGKSVNTISARDLYDYLEGKQYFTRWIKGCIKRHGFVPNTDYVCEMRYSHRDAGGRPNTEWHITLPIAIQLSRAMHTELGSTVYHWLMHQSQQSINKLVIQAESVNNDNPSLVLGNITVHQDQFGRYCLNDFHKAAGGEQKYRPKYWLESQQAKELISELDQEVGEGGIPPSVKPQPVKVVRGGNNQGTFVVKELVYAYAMWISPAFHLKVIRTFDGLVQQQLAAIQCQAVNHVIPADFVSRSEHERLQIDYHRKSRRYEFMIDNLRDQVSELLNISHQYDVLLDETAIPIDEVSKQLNLPSSVIENALNRLGWIKRDASHVDSRKILKISKDAHRREFALLDTIIKDGIPTDIVKLTRHGFLYLSGLIQSRPCLVID